MLKSIKPSREYYRLFIDESGTANPLDPKSDIYILAGCMIKKADSHDLKIKADQIKFKYCCGKFKQKITTQSGYFLNEACLSSSVGE